MKIFAITIAVFVILGNYAYSDVIHCKNGGKVEGIIKEETEDSIVIDVGFGTVTVAKDEIDYIEEATSQELEWLKKEKLTYQIEKGEWAPLGYGDIKELYLKAREDREALKDQRRESQEIKTQIFQKEQRISELLDALDKKGQELKKIDAKKNVRRYNEVIADMNSINVYLNEEGNKIKVLYEKKKDLDTNLSKLANKYRRNFQLFEDALDNKSDNKDKDRMIPDELYFLEVMGNKSNDMEGDFTKDIVMFKSEGNHIIIDAFIEEGVSARLIVDTGASIVLISNNVARKLGLRYEDIKTQIEVITADNRSVKAKPVILKSIKVGDAEVKNVEAAILDSDFLIGVDGLLGMSFLSHFIINIDVSANKLILERIL